MNWPILRTNSRHLDFFLVFFLQNLIFSIKFATRNNKIIIKLSITIMKKTFVLLATVLLMASNTFGKERSRAEMDSIAKSVHFTFTNRARTFMGETTGDCLISDAVSSIALNRQLRKAFPDVNKDFFAVYSYQERKSGYAIISTDDSMPALIAFSDSQCFNTDEIPAAMQYMLLQYTKSVNKQEETTATTRSSEITEVAPLLGVIAYSQNTPYNDKCPMLDGKRTVTGCLATAMAQIVAYYRYPTQMFGDKIEYVTETYGIPVSWDCANTKFDWDNILDTYSSGPITDYNANETTTDNQFLSFTNLKVSDGNKLEISDLYNTSSETLTGNLQLLLFDNNGRFIRPIGQIFNISDLLPGYGWGTFFIEHLIPGDIEDGNYRLYLGLKLKGSNEWSVMQRSIQNSQREEFYISLSKVGTRYTIGDWSFLCGYTKAQGEAIATLLGACGASVQMNYGPESPAKNSNLAVGLTNYFGYDDGLCFIDSWISPTKVWMEHLITTELQQKRPVYCNGATIENKAHGFVIDGYQYMDTTPYFHINWGWNGSENGYFLLDAMTTAGGDNYGNKYTLTLGIRPDDGVDDGVLFAVGEIDAAVAGQKITLTLKNFSNRTIKDFTGDIITYAIDGEGKEYVLSKNHWDSWTAFAGFESLDLSIDVPAGLPTGEHTIVLRTKESGSSVEKDVLTPYPLVLYIEGSTAIKDATITIKQTPTIYSLSGRKITSSEKLPKGLLIINGKKHINK